MRALDWLRATLVFGALYDFVYAALMVLAPDLPERLLHFYLGVMAVFLIMLGSLYLFAARDPRRYVGVIVVATLGRLAGATVFVVAALRNPDLWGLYVLAGGDLLIALSHALFFRPALR